MHMSSKYMKNLFISFARSTPLTSLKFLCMDPFIRVVPLSSLVPDLLVHMYLWVYFYQNSIVNADM